MLLSGGDAFAGPEAGLEQRERAVTQEITCIQDSLQNGRPLEWAEVCYTRDRSSFVHAQREEAIKRAMDRAEQMKGRPRQQASPAVVPKEISFPEGPPVIPHERTGVKKTSEPRGAFLSRKPLVQYEMGLETSRIRYVEPGLMEDKGTMSGVFLNYTHRTQVNQKWQNWQDSFSEKSTVNMFRLEGKYSWGEVDYHSSGTGTISHIKDHMLELRGLAGYDMPIHDALLVTPFIGLGYRYLNDDKGGLRSSTGHYGYERESQYLYLPLGIEGSTKWGSRLQMVLRMEYDYLIRGRQKSHLEDVADGFDTLVNEQRRGYGFRGALRFMYATPYVDVFVEPFIRYWWIKNSKVMTIQYEGVPVGMGLEPENKSTEYGLRLGVNY